MINDSNIASLAHLKHREGEKVAKHWAYQMWVSHAKITMKTLEAGLKQAEEEVEALSKILSKYGVPGEGRVLDLCCGIGRHAVHLAKKGYSVVGLDFSPPLIERAKKLAEEMKVSSRVEFVVGDARRASKVLAKWLESFDAVINMFTSLGFRGERDDLRILREAWRLAKPGGVLVVDIVNRDWILKNFQPSSIEEFNDLQLHEQRSFVPETSTLQSLWKFYKRRGRHLQHLASIDVELRLYSLHELLNLLRRAGWQPLESYSNFQQQLFTINSPRIVVISQRTT